MPLKQESRLVAIKTALGPDVLAVRSVSVHEQISRLFQIEAELVSENGEIDFDKVVGHGATVRLSIGQKEKRFFNGLVSRLVQVANQGGYARYRATIVPWLWFLTRTSDCCIFQEMTVPEIIEDVFKFYGFNDYLLKLSGNYQKWEYCVQYRETDFNFVSRLMEQEGIYYFFQHEDGKHTLVLADSISAHKPFPEYAEVIFHEMEKGGPGREVITDWTVEKEVQPVAFALQDFDFKKPKTSLLASSNVTRKYGNAQFEIYDYPGEYLEHDEGDRLADVRLNELQTQCEVLEGQASARGLAAGCTFKLKKHPRADQNREYLITEVMLQVDAGAFADAGGTSEAGEFFSCRFGAIDKTQQFRPARITPKPIVQGPQTAIVVGPSGEEIYTDKHARVKVHFHWDRHDESNENSSCWVRVSQYWAGKGWGSMHIPRIGQEVIVEFLEGDPDDPIITGRVYNAEQTPPYSLPDDKTKSTVKSNSTKGGGGSNELRFEDKKGGEEVFLHGEKDWTIHIKNCENETVGSSISTHAGANISRNAGANISRTANVTITDKAGKDIITNSGKNMDLQAGGSYQLHTNLGIHLKALNFMAELIESGAKAAAAAIMKGAVAGGKGAAGGAAEKAGGAVGGAEQAAKTTGLTALGPAIGAVTGDLVARQAEAEKNMEHLAEGPSQEAGKAASELQNAVNTGAGPVAVATAVMALAGAAHEAYKDAAKMVDAMLPQIPSIELWAMKNIDAFALWKLTLTARVNNIEIEAKNKDIEIKAKRNVKIEAAKKDISLEAKAKDINIKATKKKVLITAKEEVNVTSEDKDVIIKAGKEKVFVEAAEQIVLKCGDACITLKKDGSIILDGKKININGSDPVTVKGNPIKLN